MEGSKDHRWSGWPGAWCLDCGAEDKRELCAAQCHWPVCAECGGSGHVLGTCPSCSGTGSGTCPKPECQNETCPEPGSGRHDPYKRYGESNLI